MRNRPEPSHPETTAYIYIICHKNGEDFVAPIKIGVSDNPKKRLKSLSSGNPNKLEIFHQFALPTREIAFDLENAFLSVKKESRLNGEWFDLSPDDAFLNMVLNILSALTHTSADADQLNEILRISVYERGSGHGAPDFPKVRFHAKN